MKDWLLNISVSKWLHLAICFVVACFVAMLDIAEWHRPYVIAACIGAVVAFLMGLLKEIVWKSLLDRSSFDLNNLLADLVGSLFGFAFTWFAMLLEG